MVGLPPTWAPEAAVCQGQSTSQYFFIPAWKWYIKGTYVVPASPAPRRVCSPQLQISGASHTCVMAAVMQTLILLVRAPTAWANSGPPRPRFAGPLLAYPQTSDLSSASLRIPDSGPPKHRPPVSPGLKSKSAGMGIFLCGSWPSFFFGGGGLRLGGLSPHKPREEQHIV